MWQRKGAVAEKQTIHYCFSIFYQLKDVGKTGKPQVILSSAL